VAGKDRREKEVEQVGAKVAGSKRTGPHKFNRVAKREKKEAVALVHSGLGRGARERKWGLGT